jgi:hypothetical protein
MRARVSFFLFFSWEGSQESVGVGSEVFADIYQ